MMDATWALPRGGVGHRAAGYQDVDNFLGVPVAEPFAGRAVAALIDLIPMDVGEVTGSLVLRFGLTPAEARSAVMARVLVIPPHDRFERAFRTWLH